ncbi:hypothetical protein ACP70R_000203 [Stipagrostis hirtigluma subsp. patula]
MSASPRAQASAAEEQRAGGWLSTTQAGSTSSKRLKLTPRVEDDGFPLDDEALLVFAASLDTADLVRCAATCRRWRRLVTREAGFICRLNPPPPRSDGHLVRALAAGFFHHRHDDDEPGAPPRFLPFRSFHPPRAAVLDDPLLTNSRTIASRSGRLVLELHRPSRAAALRLAICNPMSGDVSVLPTLSGEVVAAGVEEVVAAAVTTLTTIGCSRRRRRRAAAPQDLAGRRAVVTNLSSRAERFPKTLFSLSRCRSSRTSRL